MRTSDLPESATDGEILARIGEWEALLARREYERALASCDAADGWSADLLRHLIEDGWDDPGPHHVTVEGHPRALPAGGACVRVALRDVRRFGGNAGGEVAEVWYDLHVNGVASDLTATFRLVRVPGGLRLRFIDVNVK